MKAAAKVQSHESCNPFKIGKGVHDLNLQDLKQSCQQEALTNKKNNTQQTFIFGEEPTEDRVRKEKREGYNLITGEEYNVKNTQSISSPISYARNISSKGITPVYTKLW